MSLEGVNNKPEIDPIAYEDEYIYGFKNMSKGVFKIRGVEFPEIVCEINKKRGDEVWLQKMMQRHGVSAVDLEKNLMSFILLRLAGCTVGGAAGETSFLGMQTQEVKLARNYPDLNKFVKDKLLERQTFFLRYPEKDERIKMYLDIIEKKTGILPLEIFDEDHIPNYNRKVGSPSSKKRVSKRSLLDYLQEISLAVTGNKMKEIAVKTNRGHSVVSNALNNQSNYKSLSKKMIEKIREIQGWV